MSSQSLLNIWVETTWTPLLSQKSSFPLWSTVSQHRSIHTCGLTDSVVQDIRSNRSPAPWVLYWASEDDSCPILAFVWLPKRNRTFQILQHWTWYRYSYIWISSLQFKIKFSNSLLVIYISAVLGLMTSHRLTTCRWMAWILHNPTGSNRILQ